MMRAVVYCRVSTKEQVKNLSLSHQKRSCLTYCQQEGWTVARHFVEEGESAKTADRTELKRLLAYCRKHKDAVDFVLVYSLDRFARSNYDHHVVRALLAQYGISLRSVTQPIDDSPAGQLMEGMLAAIAQFDNDVRAQRTVDGMQEALSRGRWTFQAPVGYRNVQNGAIKAMEPDENLAPAIRRAFELMATGSVSQPELLDELYAKGLSGARGGNISGSTLARILRNPIYMGRVVVPKWDIDTQGDFEPIVPPDLFYQVQRVLDDRSAGKIEKRQRNNPDFPLRRIVRCSECGRGFTGSWSRNKVGKLYAYYNCPDHHTKAPKEKLEEAFEDLLEQLAPSPELLAAFREIIVEKWEERRSTARETAQRISRQLTEIQKKQDRLFDAFVYRQAIPEETYRREIEQLKEREALLRMQRNESEVEEYDLDATLAFAESVAINAKSLWKHLEINERRRFQDVLFPEGLTFDGESYSNTRMCFLFNDLRAESASVAQVVSPTGLDPNTALDELADFARLRVACPELARMAA